MRAHPELARTLIDLEFMVIGMATFLGAGQLLAFATLSLRDRVVWPPWLGRLAIAAAIAYALRIGTLFTTSGPFAADGVLGLWIPVIGLAGWTFAASVTLALRARAGPAGV